MTEEIEILRLRVEIQAIFEGFKELNAKRATIAAHFARASTQLPRGYNVKLLTNIGLELAIIEKDEQTREICMTHKLGDYLSPLQRRWFDRVMPLQEIVAKPAPQARVKAAVPAEDPPEDPKINHGYGINEGVLRERRPLEFILKHCWYGPKDNDELGQIVTYIICRHRHLVDPSAVESHMSGSGKLFKSLEEYRRFIADMKAQGWLVHNVANIWRWQIDRIGVI